MNVPKYPARSDTIDTTTAALRRLADARHQMVVDTLATLDHGIVGDLRQHTTTKPELTAVGRQLIIGAERLVRAGASAESVRRAAQAALSRLRPLDGGMICATVGDGEDLVPDLLTPTVRPANDEVRTLLADANRIIGATEFAERPPHHGPLVLTLRQITIKDVARSSANTRLYGSIYLDILDDPHLVARDVVHEATHCWLNDLLVALRLRLDSSAERYWSPWKRCLRPEFGFVHSIASFSVVVVFLDSLIETLGPQSIEGRRLGILAEAERERLVDCRADVASLELPGEITTLLVPVYERAIRVA